MSDHRITRNQAKDNAELKEEINAFDPFKPKNKLESTPPRSTDRNRLILDQSLESIPELVNAPSAPALIDLLSKEEVPDQEIKMTATAQVVSIKDELKIIPEYDGKSIPLSQFLEGCTEALAMVDSASDKETTPTRPHRF